MPSRCDKMLHQLGVFRLIGGEGFGEQSRRRLDKLNWKVELDRTIWTRELGNLEVYGCWKTILKPLQIRRSESATKSPMEALINSHIH